MSVYLERFQTSWKSQSRPKPFHFHGFDAELVVAGEQGGARWHAPGADVGCGEADAFFGESVDVGSADPRVSFGVGADGAVGVIVGVDEKDVWAFGLGWNGGGAGEEPEKLAAGGSWRRHLKWKMQLCQNVNFKQKSISSCI